MSIDNFEYTSFLESKLKTDMLSDDTFDYDNVRIFLNGDSFRNFSSRLLSFYNSKVNSTYSPDEAKADFLNRCKEKNIKFNRNTADNWFKSGKSPKFGDADRENIYKLAFALSLDLSGVEDLFKKVYLDRPFNLRNIREFVYYYCFIEGKSYQDAEMIIGAVSNLTVSAITADDNTIGTIQIGDFAWSADDYKSIVEYIIDHQHNFSLNSVSAKKRINELAADIKGTKETPGLAYLEVVSLYGTNSSENDYIFGKNTHSTDFMLLRILGNNPARSPLRKGSSPDNVNEIRKLFRDEIANQFPDKHSFEPSVNSSYILRKSLILLFFYWYWVKDLLCKQFHASYESFCSDLNDILEECGLSLLYPGNPYDWLFLYCSARKNDEEYPLDIFRDIISFESNDDDIY